MTIAVDWGVKNQTKQTKFQPLSCKIANVGPPRRLGIWGEWLFIFRDLMSTGNYFRGAGVPAHRFGDLRSPAKKQKKK